MRYLFTADFGGCLMPSALVMPSASVMPSALVMRGLLAVWIAVFAGAGAAMASAPVADTHAPAEKHYSSASSGDHGEGGVEIHDEDYIPPNSSNMPMLLLPVVINGRMSHYLFVSYRLVMNNELQVDTVNQKIAWLHDAFMRKVYKIQLHDPQDPDNIDLAKLEDVLKKEANRMLHASLVKHIYVLNVQSENKPTPYPDQRPAGGSKDKKPSGGGH